MRSTHGDEVQTLSSTVVVWVSVLLTSSDSTNALAGSAVAVRTSSSGAPRFTVATTVIVVSLLAGYPVTTPAVQS